MNAPVKNMEADPLAKMREPFAPNQISKLPKPTKKQTEEVRNDYKKGKRCDLCGAWHHPDVVHLDYVGHAALTDRLLDTDPHWHWEPVAFNEHGLPAFDQSGGLWIKLTVCGVTRLGYGHAAGKQNQDPGAREKEVIGDALRNAAMRFGAALDLWHKGQLHATEADDTEPEQKRQTDRKKDPKGPSKTTVQKGLKELSHEMGTVTDMREWYALKNQYSDLIAIVEREYPDWWNGWPDQPDGFTPLRRKSEMLEAQLSPQSNDDEFGDVSESDLAA